MESDRATLNQDSRGFQMSKQESYKFPCTQCDFKAKRKAHLLTHEESIHKDIKFPCTQCDYKATRKENLMAHKKSMLSRRCQVSLFSM